MKYRIDDINDPRVRVYTAANEKQLKRYYEPSPGLFICESERVIRRALHAGYEPESVFVVTKKAGSLDDLNGIPFYVADTAVMKQITGFEMTGGVLAAMRRKQPEKTEEFLLQCKKIAVLEDIENPTNVGAIFRSAAALGAEAVLLTKGCADPLYRRAARVSMGNVFSVPWRFVPENYVSLLKEYGYYTMALALSSRAVSLKHFTAWEHTKRAVILGNEDHGISEHTLTACDAVVRIPMADGVDSLNVSAASAVAFWELFEE